MLNCKSSTQQRAPCAQRAARLPQRCCIRRRQLRCRASSVQEDGKFGAQVCVVLGTQWGDEGKGKLVDVLAQQYDVVARAQVRERGRQGSHLQPWCGVRR
jgi:hypothetical protein